MKRYSSRRALDVVQDALKRKVRETRKKKYNYRVPALWAAARGRGKATKVHPYAYYLDVVGKIKRVKPARRARSSTGEWTREAVIYNMFIRTTAAFDHNANGVLDLPVNPEGLRETGTFLKAIAMLPYIKRMGATAVHLLPTTAIGHDGNKGSLGSPYAIRNPYELDENLSEPSLGLEVKTEFKAFVEAAHRYGLRVVLEFVFRTSAKDGDWIKEHPEWFYWIREEVETRNPQQLDEGKYGSPIFTREELERIHHDVTSGRLGDLTPPHEIYRAMFASPPDPGSVEKIDGRWIGTLPGGQRVKIPGAFADWPPDDNQPPWGDVTYLRMYTHPDFNYIGYNTIRMYDTRLTEQKFINRPLWDRIVGIIPYYQREFHIDGVMIDMGHALPMALKAELVAKARSMNPDFAFWDENFSITQKSRDEGYNAVFGYLWVDEHHPPRMKKFVHTLSREGFPIPYFGTPENHNTPRAASRPGGTAYSRWAFVVNSFIPAIPFIHSGYELAEKYPINTGLDFTPEQIRKLPSEKLPLFSEYPYDWLSRDEFSGFVKTVLAVRARYLGLISDPAPASVVVLHPEHDHVLAFARVAPKGGKRLAVVGNTNFVEGTTLSLPLETKKSHCTDLLSGKSLKYHEGKVQAHLAPGECLVFEY
jgi:starch synthase (maltosyl-transferring)